MEKRLNLKNKRITIMGLGLNQGGLGVARFLARAGARVLVTDLKTKKELAPSLKQLQGLPIKYVLGRHREQDFIKTDMIIRNPGVPDNSPFLKIARKHRVPIETDMTLFWQLCPSKNIIGVTGTKGKSTTASLITHIFKTAKKDTVLAGNIGISVLDALPKIKKDTWVVLELSSWQLEGVGKHRISPHIAVMTNILPDHLNKYKNFAAYSRAKQLILKYQEPGNLTVLNYDNLEVRKAAKKIKARVVWYSGNNPSQPPLMFPPEADPPLAETGGVIPPLNIRGGKGELSLLPLRGAHNLSNVLAASTLSAELKIPPAIISKAIKTFKGVPNRLEHIHTFQGISFYNDTTATTPDACLAALRSFKEPIILIAGGQDKNLNYNELGKAIATLPHVQKVFLLTHPAYDASRKLLATVKKYGGDTKVTLALSIEEAVKKAWRTVKSEIRSTKSETNSNDQNLENSNFGIVSNFDIRNSNFVILLSPAAASFGMFQNEFDRGKQFVDAVKKLKTQNSKRKTTTLKP